MSKKDYIDAVNEIQVDEKLKKETFEKVREKTVRRKFNKLYPIASLAVMCAVIMAIVLPNKSIAPIKEKEYIQGMSSALKMEYVMKSYNQMKTSGEVKRTTIA